MDFSTLFNRIAVFLATGFYLSYLPVSILNLFKSRAQASTLAAKKWTGAGIIGSLLGWATYAALPDPFANAFLFLLMGMTLAIVTAHQAEQVFQTKDDSRIIVDEWIGAWIALQGTDGRFSYPTILAVVLFRVFDVYKGPWGRWIQTWPGGFGIVMDDVAAGLIANSLIRVFHFLNQ